MWEGDFEILPQISSTGSAGRRTVYDYFSKGSPWLFPVARWIKDASGLILVTTDTKFGDFVSNPNSQVLKTYLLRP
jgi:16S rRNA U516 pseudouridylate synthase RsuA-like enzyme